MLPNIPSIGDGSLREFIERLLNDYVSASKEDFKGSVLGSYIRQQVPEEIYSTGIVNPEYYKVDGSVGQGNWAEVPWVAVFDKQITTSATSGVYIVYLLSNDGSSLYLTLNQGSTDLKKTHGKKKAILFMHKKAEKISAALNSHGFFKGNNITLGENLGELGQLYQEGTIFYKEYVRGQVPSEDTLRRDLQNMVEVYVEYVNRKEEFDVDDLDLEAGTPDISLGDEKIYSWLKLKDGRYAKRVDISVIKYFGSVIPQNIYPFFDLSLPSTDTSTRHYPIHFRGSLLNRPMEINMFQTKDRPSPGYRVWLKDKLLKPILRTAKLNEDAITFEKIGEHEYNIDVVPYESLVSENDTLPYPHNRIIYGAPGTGKSFKLNQEMTACLKSNICNFERVTFHPDYSYANFVGTYKPVPDFDEDGKKTISYKFVPGPFLRIYTKAITHTNEPFLLLIEEINRAMVAAVFGDIFQLLDRKKSGESEYPITTSEDVRRYLAETLGKAMSEVETISLPSNLYIWATMNSADQGVFPMDTAFKRRWDFEYIDINTAEEGIAQIVVDVPTEAGSPKSISWNALRRAINNKMIDCGINEDKLLGPYFLSPDSFVNEDGSVNSQKFQTVFKHKVIMYLFEDAGKQYRGKLFGGAFSKNHKTYSAICSCFDEVGIDIFPDEIKNPVIQQYK